MKSSLLRYSVALGLTVAIISLNSCKKDTTDSDLTSSYNLAQADETYNDVHNIADEAVTNGSVTYKTDDANSLLAGCAVVTRDTVAMPHTATIDFGTGCTGVDGRTRSGKILVSYDGPYRAAGTTITITFDNFFVNGNQVLGTKTIHNDGTNGDGFMAFSINVSGQLVLASGAGTISWTSQRTRVWIAGESTQTRDDDQYSITGSGSGTAANGDQFNATIQTPLIRNLAPGCRGHFTQGTVLIQRTGRPDRLVDFGNGSCDDEAVVTINGHTHLIHLH